MSGILAMTMLGGARIVLNGDSVTDIEVHPSTATATINVTAAGTVTGTDSGTYPWLKGGLSSNYEIEATLNSGTVTGTFGSWLNLGTTRSWSLTESSIGTKLGSITLQIRPVGGSAIATATITFHAEVD